MCKLGLSPKEVEKLHEYFDTDKDGLVSFDEFVHVIRGRLNPVRKNLVLKVFHALDDRGDANGYLTVTDIQPFYDCSRHPDVVSGKRKEKQVCPQT